MVNIISVLLTTIVWMLGGQFGSAWRKYGIMAISVAYCAYNVSCGTSWLSYIPIMPFCAILFLGYGEKSWFMKVLKNEELVRIIDALALAIPLLVICFLRHKQWFNYLIVLCSLIGAFQIRGGGFKIGNKDFLFVDLARGFAVGLSLTQAF